MLWEEVLGEEGVKSRYEAGWIEKETCWVIPIHFGNRSRDVRGEKQGERGRVNLLNGSNIDDMLKLSLMLSLSSDRGIFLW